VEGNEEADRLAGAAHDDEAAIGWSATRLPPPPSRRHWLHYGSCVVPWRERRIVREQDEAVTARRLREQLDEAATATTHDAANIAAHATPAMRADDARQVLEALQWTVESDGSTTQRRCARKTSKEDAALRSFSVKQLFNLLPTQLRNHRWYPHVETHTQCPRCRAGDESAAHVVRCADQEALEQAYREAVRELDSAKRISGWMLAALAPWRDLHWLQGRVHPGWRRAVAAYGVGDKAVNGVLRTLVRAGMVATHRTAWLPRCNAMAERHREEGVRSRTRRRQMQTQPEPGTREATRRRLRSYPKDHGWQRQQNGKFMCSLMQDTGGQMPGGV
jgi:hypothetical protein